MACDGAWSWSERLQSPCARSDLCVGPLTPPPAPRGVGLADLKPENILVHSSGHLMLTDFDLAAAEGPTAQAAAAVADRSRSPVRSPARATATGDGGAGATASGGGGSGAGRSDSGSPAREAPRGLQLKTHTGPRINRKVRAGCGRACVGTETRDPHARDHTRLCRLVAADLEGVAATVLCWRRDGLCVCRDGRQRSLHTQVHRSSAAHTRTHTLLMPASHRGLLTPCASRRCSHAHLAMLCPQQALLKPLVNNVQFGKQLSFVGTSA